MSPGWDGSIATWGRSNPPNPPNQWHAGRVRRGGVSGCICPNRWVWWVGGGRQMGGGGEGGKTGPCMHPSGQQVSGRPQTGKCWRLDGGPCPGRGPDPGPWARPADWRTGRHCRCQPAGVGAAPWPQPGPVPRPLATFGVRAWPGLTCTMGADWKCSGASGRQAGVADSVALLSTTASRPAMASTLPAGTWPRATRPVAGGNKEQGHGGRGGGGWLLFWFSLFWG